MKDNQKLKNIIQDYINNPVKFAEDFCGVKISRFQRLWLKVLMRFKTKEVRR